MPRKIQSTNIYIYLCARVVEMELKDLFEQAKVLNKKTKTDHNFSFFLFGRGAAKIRNINFFQRTKKKTKIIPCGRI